MASKTEYLELTMPENGEYVDGWDKPVNANFETIDDHLKDLRADLVGASGDTSTLGTPDLDTRLNAAMDATGKLDLESSESFTNLQDSKVYARSFASSASDRVADRFENAENEVVNGRNGVVTDRYGNLVQDGAIAHSLVAAMYHNKTDGIQSPISGFAPNSVVDGPKEMSNPQAPLHLRSVGFPKEVIINASPGVNVVYNIDGYYFEILNRAVIDISKPSVLASGTYHMWASRNEADYRTAYFKEYEGQSLGGSFKIEPRIIPTHASHRADAPSWAGPGNPYSLDPTNGSVIVDQDKLTSVTASFGAYGVKAGDLLIVSSPASVSGTYVVDSVTSDTELVIGSQFPETASNITFHVERRSYPALGYSSSLSFSAGRVYIGKFVVNGSGDITSIIGYAYSGLFDTGWNPMGLFNGPGNRHYLGVQPSNVDIMIRESNSPSARVIYNPTTKVNVEQIDEVGSTASMANGILTVPAFTVEATDETFRLYNTSPLGDSKAIYDNGSYVAYDDSNYQIRVIARR